MSYSLGTNVSLFKLPEFKSIRQALQPIMDSLPRRDGNSDGNRGKKRKLRTSEDDILAEKEKNYINQVSGTMVPLLICWQSIDTAKGFEKRKIREIE